MSIRAVYTFRDSDGGIFAVYKHHDGYPAGAAEFIEKAKALSWGAGRFDASEFAAAFVAANKTGAGDVYLSKGYRAHGDIDYDYVITGADGALFVEVYMHWYRRAPGETTRDRLWAGPLSDLAEWAKDPAF